MKAHIGVDSKEGIVHSVCSTAASVSDMHMLPELLHGGEKEVWGDAGYQVAAFIRHGSVAPFNITELNVETNLAGLYIQIEANKRRI